jgi:succinate dehydrogenase/fumarate reductase-like Fe-S protein
MGLCGACTVHVEGKAMRSCVTNMSDVAGKRIMTIEGLSQKGDHPVQESLADGERAAVPVIVKAARSCKQRRRWPKSPNRRIAISMKPCNATSADVERINGSGRR